MEGPTPVSALIHSATMVGIGFLLLLKLSTLFQNSSEGLETIVFIGAITTLLTNCGSVACYDIKGVNAKEKFYTALKDEKDPEKKRKATGKYPKFELITSHIGRRSFATNHYGKFTNHVIMQVTGHQTERQFLDYIGKRSTEHITDFMKFWKEQQESKESTSQKIG